MSSTIRTTIESVISTHIGSVPAGYQSVVDGVVEAVEGLAQQAAESIRESASGVASPEQVEAALVAAGLVEPEPVPVVEEPATSEDRLSKIESLVERLVAAAEARGLHI